MKDEKLIILNETNFKEITTLFKEVFEGEPWNHDWSNEKQLKEYIRENAGTYNALNYGLYKNGKMIAFSCKPKQINKHILFIRSWDFKKKVHL